MLSRPKAAEAQLGADADPGVPAHSPQPGWSGLEECPACHEYLQEPATVTWPRKVLTRGDIVADALDHNPGVFDRLAKFVHHHAFDAPVHLQDRRVNNVRALQRARTTCPASFTHLSSELESLGKPALRSPAPHQPSCHPKSPSLSLSLLICEVGVTGEPISGVSPLAMPPRPRCVDDAAIVLQGPADTSWARSPEQKTPSGPPSDALGPPALMARGSVSSAGFSLS